MVVVVVLLTILFHLVQPVCPVHPTLFRETERSSLTRARLITDEKGRPVDDGTRKRTSLGVHAPLLIDASRPNNRSRTGDDAAPHRFFPLSPVFYQRCLDGRAALISARWLAVPLDATLTTTLCVPVYTRIELLPSWLLAEKRTCSLMNFSTSQDDSSRPPRRRKRAPGP